MSNNDITDTVDEIIDLTDVVSVGNAGDKTDAASVEDDVLDSLVNDFEKNIGSVSAPEANEEKEESDEPLDLAKLDNLINSYNLDFDADEKNNQGENPNASEIENQNDMDVAFVSDGQQLHNMQTKTAPDAADINDKQADFNPGPFDQNDDLDTNDIPSFEDIDLPSLEDENEEGHDDIDLLTKDIIDGTNNAKTSSGNDINDTASDDSFSAFLNEEAAKQEAKPKQVQTAAPRSKTQQIPDPRAAAPKAENHAAAAIQKNTQQMPAPDMPEISADDTSLQSDMAEDAEEINEDAFNNILNELSLEHETDEEVVPFAQEAPSNTEPIHLKGDVSFIEAQGKEKANDDIHLVQSASKVLASGEAYLEKFSGEDDSVGAKIKNLSTRVASLEQRLVGSDSKSQDNALELTYRINGLETKITELQEAVKAELITIKTESAKIDSIAEENNAQENSPELAGLTDKIQTLETRIATLDDIFSEQKMLNDELSKNLETLIQDRAAPDNSSQVQVLEEKITALEGELSQAKAKITDLEENIEKAASLAAAKVLREEIIPLLG